MDVLLDTVPFTRALLQVRRVVRPQNTLPVLGGIALTAQSPDAVTLRATDLITSWEVTIPATVHTPGSAVLSAGAFTEWVRRISLPTMTLQATPNHQIRFRAGASQATFQILSDPLPQFPSVSAPAVTLPAAVFTTLQQRILFATSKDETRPTLQGVALTLGDGQVRAEATDGTRFTRAVRALPTATAAPHTLILPTKTLLEVAAQVAESPTILLRLDSHTIQFEWPHQRLISALHDGVFPDLPHVPPDAFVTHCRVSTSALRQSIERVQLFTNKSSLYTVRLTVAPGAPLEVDSSDADRGMVAESLDAEIQGEPMTLLFNAQLLLDGLSHFPTEALLLEFSGPQSAACCSPDPDAPDYDPAEAFGYTLLPLRQRL